MSTLYAYLINPFTRAITEVEYSGDFHQIYHYIEADTFDVARVNDKGDGIFVDDEGLYREGQRFFWIEGYPQPLAGKGLYLGCDLSNGESVSPYFTLEEVNAAVKWVTPIRRNGQIEWVEWVEYEDLSAARTIKFCE